MAGLRALESGGKRKDRFFERTSAIGTRSFVVLWLFDRGTAAIKLGKCVDYSTKKYTVNGVKHTFSSGISFLRPIFLFLTNLPTLLKLLLHLSLSLPVHLHV